MRNQLLLVLPCLTIALLTAGCADYNANANFAKYLGVMAIGIGASQIAPDSGGQVDRMFNAMYNPNYAATDLSPDYDPNFQQDPSVFRRWP
jgi:hypothetical protein